MAIHDDATIDTTGHLESQGDIAAAFENFWKEQDALDKAPSEQSDEAKKKPQAQPEAEDEDAEVSDDEAEDDTEDANEPSEDDEGDEDAAEDDSEDEQSEKESKKKYSDDDEVYTKIKVGDEEHEVPIKDLKRLYGQEAALTKKSMEVAEKGKAADAHTARAIAALDVLSKQAKAAADPYRSINWAQLMKDPSISAEDVHALQQTAKQALDNEAFLGGQLDTLMKATHERLAADQRAAATESLKALTTEGNPNYVKGWNDQLYNDLRSFAVAQGVEAHLINNLTDAATFKLLNMAMQFHKGSKTVTVTKKVNKSPKKIVKSSTASAGSDSRTTKAVTRRDALSAQKRAGGDMDATVDAFAAILGGDK